MKAFLAELTLPLLRFLSRDFTFWAHEAQLPPRGRWRAWLFLGGRGAGKTRAGAEWIKAQAVFGGRRRLALIAPTLHDVREVMIEGASGVCSGANAPVRYDVSRRRLVWPNGAEAFGFSAEDPDSLRGPQFDAAWADELGYWAKPDATLETLGHALRLGDNPQLMVTTTPRPIAALKRLAASPDVVITHANTWKNAHNLSAGFMAALRQHYTGSARQRQELQGELIEDALGALWTRAQLEACRESPPEHFDEIVVAVDPPASVGEDADACGIIAAARAGDCAYVLADASAQGLSPSQWAARAAALSDCVSAHAILAEANNGGEMVRSVLHIAAPDATVLLVHAQASKHARALPISALYARGKVRHVGPFPALEDEMCAFGVSANSKSPDRLDALVWALTHLMLARAAPRMRPI